MVNTPEMWSTYQKYGQHNKNIVKHTRNMVNVPEIWSTYQKYGQHATKKEKIRYLDNKI